MDLRFDEKSFIINGERKFFISGEFPYFRVPRKDWARRLELFVQSGGNCVATYVPWIIHEPNEGEILFDDCNERNLTAFMEEVKAQGLMLVLRPGPYVYSELLYCGLPTWLVKNYPEIKAKNIDGQSFYDASISYLHPLFLEKVKKYYEAFSRVIVPYLSENGGPVIMVQVDNELIGSHEWFGSYDYNPTTMGFGRKDGRYPLYLQKVYGEISALNEAYGTSYESFVEVSPKPEKERGKETARCMKDYHDFYCETVEEYALVLKEYLQGFGVQTTFCHNAAGATMIPLFKDMNKKLGDDFLLGVDNYYTLNITWAQNNPTPQYFTRVLFAADQLKMLGNPPTVMEMPGGSPSQIPPILKDDLYTCYMTNLAAGLRGVNYYIYTGGKNFAGTGHTADVYDYNAFISADGTVRDTYQALVKFHKVLHDNEWLCDAERFVSVQVGTEWQTLRGNHYAHKADARNTVGAQYQMDKCAMFSLLCGKYSGAYTDLQGRLDVTKPLLICSPDTMSEKAQNNVVEFLKKGGKVFLLTTIPSMNESFEPCTILKDFIGEIQTEKKGGGTPVTIIEKERIYGISCENKITRLPNGTTAFAKDGEGNILGFRKKIGQGEMVYLGGNWLTTDFVQTGMLERVLEGFGARACVQNSNGCIFSTLYEGKNEKGVFLLNLYTGDQETEVTVYGNGEPVRLGKIKLAPMEVKLIRLGN